MRPVDFPSLIALLAVTCPGADAWGDESPFVYVKYTRNKHSATSTLVEKGQAKSRYGAAMAFDHDMTTAWCEGKSDDGVGESVAANFSPLWVPGFNVFHGFGKNGGLYRMNNRVKDFEITFLFKDGRTSTHQGTFTDDVCGKSDRGGPCEEMCPNVVARQKHGYKSHEDCCAAETKKECLLMDYDVIKGGQFVGVKDPQSGQVVKEGGWPGHCLTGVRLTIKSTYKGSKYNDTCIAEIQPVLPFLGVGIPAHLKAPKDACEAK
jgi:hypothetical protein